MVRSNNKMKTFLCCLCVVSLLIGCGCGWDRHAIDPKDYSNDLTEEVFRFQFDRFPHDSKDMAYLVVWGYRIEPVPAHFIARFEDLDHDVVSISDVTQKIDGTKLPFRLKNDTNEVARPVAMFQAVHLEPGDDGRKLIEIARMHENQSLREIVAVDESQAGLAKFRVIREIPSLVVSPSEPDSSTNSPPATEESRILAIAREAVAKNDTWVERAEFERPKRQADGSWSVMVWRLPKTPGGHRSVVIDKSGVVTNYHRGL
jgi:hypothetical protein